MEAEMFPEKIYYEPQIEEYAMGKSLMRKYNNVPWIPIENHNNIFELRTRPNQDFIELKKYLIIGTRKTHRYAENFKISDYLVPFTSSGCPAMCLYCYLVCNYNKCSYLRVFVNQEQMLGRLIKKSNAFLDDKVFEIGSNSDLILENRITDSLPETIEQFAKHGKGVITFPTKFGMVEDLLPLNHQGKVIFRMSVNPQQIISDIEIGTSNLNSRIEALIKMYEAGYKVGILIAPIVMVEGWKPLYEALIDQLAEKLPGKLKEYIQIEIIFMTYSYVHRAINEQAFPDKLSLYHQERMTGRGRGKYCYKQAYREDGEQFLREQIGRRFHDHTIVYVV